MAIDLEWKPEWQSPAAVAAATTARLGPAAGAAAGLAATSQVALMQISSATVRCAYCVLLYHRYVLLYRRGVYT